MANTIHYRLLDRTCILRRCLHAGPVPLQETDPACDANVAAETEAKVPHGTIDAFLKALCRQYGAYGIAALDGDMVVGQVRFYPTALAKMWKTTRGTHLNACVQEHDQIQAMAAADMDTMPAKSDLNPRSLSMACFQVVNDYKAMAEGRPAAYPSYLHQGIGTTLLAKTVEWARSEGWQEIRDQAIPHIPPIMAWHCHLSVERYRKLGFTVTPSADTLDGPVSQRRGFHGEAMKRMWEPYAHMSDEEVARLYNVVLRIT